ncbi:uncharacterized protein MONOS_3374 [Monocercomonoides exilis]|uniref:uncharacterized protein n=1 Tax=Monocercomonoides exilis TaxID=2049356 RepID=UPI00355A7FA2|nr:hypothetical protein MONOS_3374 [Monocercomonoides exilis]|eukprot:MONOS_3374.1-p1 / transcript=MONOS_3374.1 / gene=MONOS_3374 / organism=Monocercomonoides_exilis_PA203 / gene_product=unspecified product / transcript_product=unspecified product / location=Mono_scaffold00079:28192-38034(+) / protein_length=3131 / sequence_SO=supercontig / SO=protein_coding / is_pseudo=false
MDDIPLLPKITTDFIVSNCTFIKIIRKRGNGKSRSEAGNGGGMSIVMEDTGSLIMGAAEEMEFKSCGAGNNQTIKGRGGGLFLQVEGNVACLLLKMLQFQNCDAWKGKNIFVEAERIGNVVNRERFAYCLSLDRSKEEEAMGMSREHEEFYVPLLFYLQSSFDGPAFVGGVNNLDFDQCGFSGYPCSSIWHTVELRFKSSTREIQVNEGFEWREIVEMKDYEWNIRAGLKGRNVKVSPQGDVPESGMIVVSKKSTLVNISFVLCSSLSGSATTFISCLSDELDVVDCSALPLSESSSFCVTYNFVEGFGGIVKFDSFEQIACVITEACGLIRINGECSLECNLCSFGMIQKQNGNGGCIEVRRRSDGQGRRDIKFDGCSFSNCCVKENRGCGGGMYVELGSDDYLIVNGSSIFEGCCAQYSASGKGKGGGLMIEVNDASGTFIIGEDVVFSNEIVNEASCGKDLFVGCESGVLLNEFIFADRMRFFDNSSEPSDILKMSGSENGMDEPILPLHIFLYTLSSAVIVDGNAGTDHSYCGFSFFPCCTINFCGKERISRNSNQMNLISSTAINSEMIFSEFPIVINATLSNIHVTVSDEGPSRKCSMIDYSVPMRIMQLIFDLPHSFQSPHSSFVASSVFLKMRYCEFCFPYSPSGLTIGFGLIEAKGGDVELDGLMMTDAVSFNFNSVFCMENVNCVAIENCTFAGLTRENGDGGCIALNGMSGDEPSVLISNSSISSSCEGGFMQKGGGIKTHLSFCAELSISKCKFLSCSVPASEREEIGNGLGGGLFIDTASECETFQLKELVFESCIAWSGNNLFVGANFLQQVISTTSLAFDRVGMKRNDLIGQERGTVNDKFYVPLELYFLYFGDKGHVGSEFNNGFDHTGCGYEDYPCRTIPFLLNLRHDTFSSFAHIVLLSSFIFRDALIFETMEMVIGVKMEMTEIKTSSEGIYDGEGLIETHNKITFEEITFSIPQNFSRAQRKSHFLCLEGILVLTDCSLKAHRGVPTYNFVTAKGGKVCIYNFSLSLLEYGTACIIEISGEETQGFLSEMKFENVRKDGVGGLISAREGSILVMENSEISGPQQFRRHGAIIIDESSSLEVKKSNFSLLTREAGNGAVTDAKIGRRGKMEMFECIISSVACIEQEARGGSIFATVEGGGMFVFENNTIEGSEVKVANGLGGGLHLSFGTVDVEYSMRQNKFIGNKAMLGYDVYLVCSAPRLVVNRNKWAGSATEEQDEKTLWVIDPEHPSGNDSMMKYLFGHPESIVYVSTEMGQMEGCGSEDFPCYEMSYGYLQMVEEQDTIMVLLSCELNGEINREKDPMTICGKGENGSELRVGKEGHLSVPVGTSLMQLTIERIKFVLPTESVEDELVKVGVGTVYFVLCTFDGRDEALSQISLMIVRGCGGSVQFDRTCVNGMMFLQRKGIAYLSGGSLVILGEDGGGLKSCIGANGRLIVDNCTIQKSLSKKEDGKGGENAAWEGRDVFIVCSDLNESATKERFDMELINDMQKGIVDMKGIDTIRFLVPVDLLLFVVQRKTDKIEVSPDGFDLLGCGVHDLPCNTFWRGFFVASAEDEKKASMRIGNKNCGDIEEAIFMNKETLKINWICLVSSNRGFVEMKYIHVNNFSCDLVPFCFKSAVIMFKCIFENVYSENNCEGGAVKIELKSNDKAVANSTLAERCKCTEQNGKGGWMYVKCFESTSINPFLFEDTSFVLNDAAIGKNLFIKSFDLNATVTLASFLFGFDELKNDQSLFVGSDESFAEADLFMFLVEFKSLKVFVSSFGHDVMRCGGKEEPCMTLWKSIRQSKVNDNSKEMVVAVILKVCLDECFNLSGYIVESSTVPEEAPLRAIVEVKNKIEGMSCPCIVNEKKLMLRMIALSVVEGFESEEGGVIVNKEGILKVENCLLESNGSSEMCGSYSFIVIEKGELQIEKLDMQDSNARCSLIVIKCGCCCSLSHSELTWGTIFEGCVVDVIDSLESNEEAKSQLHISNSSFNSLSGSNSFPCIIKSDSASKVGVEIINTRFEMCKASASVKGGVGWIKLNHGGEFSLKHCDVIQCGCSSDEGRGGGFYLSTDENGTMNFVFQNSTFKGNNAKTGNDIFIECVSIFDQIDETHFLMDLREGIFNRMNAIWGIDNTDNVPVDLMKYITIHQADIIIVSSAREKAGKNDRQCGTKTLPCLSLDYGLNHLTSDLESRLLIETEGLIAKEVQLGDVTLASRNSIKCSIGILNGIEVFTENLVSSRGNTSIIRCCFLFNCSFVSMHMHFLFVEGGLLSLLSCSFASQCATNAGSVTLPLNLICVGEGQLEISELEVRGLSFDSAPILQLFQNAKFAKINGLNIENIKMKFMSVIEFCTSSFFSNEDEAIQSVLITLSVFENITHSSDGAAAIDFSTSNIHPTLSNCSFSKCISEDLKGSIASFISCRNATIEQCLFSGDLNVDKLEKNESITEFEDICRFNGSLIEMKSTFSFMKDSTVINASFGGLSICGGDVRIEMGMFMNNNPHIWRYPSLRRNIMCSDSGTVDFENAKGGDGVFPYVSLWIQNDKCVLTGLTDLRPSSLFIPSIKNVSIEEKEMQAFLKFEGALLLPCNLSYVVSVVVGDEEMVESHDFDMDMFESEEVVRGIVNRDFIDQGGEETEVSVKILFGKENERVSTEPFILKNRSEPKANGDERIVEGGKEGKSYWLLIVIVLVVILLIILISLVIFIVRWRKVKERNEELQEIVNDNIRKDPKAFEMVTMEMSPEEQWRRAEREAEKKNEERIKKRVYDSNMQHSESSEYLLSESGSTEYILGRDSDKIPEWALEKVEEEEIRKRTPSPSISSTSTIDTSDTESTFVRGEDLCPTTSSMSNLVDAMACSSPHEKLIVDLRDSLFMLLHGRNEKKEMEIGSLQQREQTAAQILFWVANGALHSFEEMDDPLQSLSNLSPHIVLFSEHMVICIVMHSDLLSNDSDSSSISSSTVVTSASDDDDEDSLPSSAFDDEDSLKKECLRWKAPELLINKSLGATKESVSFSIGMMLWECLTLQIPFGEYEAEVAGKKIANGERPVMAAVRDSSFCELVKLAVSEKPGARPILSNLKREFIQRFPAGAVILTMSDAVTYKEGSQENSEVEQSGSLDSSEIIFINSQNTRN